jgi:selenobiotic family peptide radical SAM maturase
MKTNAPDTLYRACRAVLGEAAWSRLSLQELKALVSRTLSTALTRIEDDSIPRFLPDLARLEEVYASVEERKGLLTSEVELPSVNPTLQILELSWSDLTSFLDKHLKFSDIHPIQKRERVVLWYHVLSGRVIARPTSDEDLLVLKMVVEGIAPEAVAAQGGLPVGAVDNALYRAGESGLLLMPRSLLRRDLEVFHSKKGIPEQYLSSPSFTLQWHITQACDLHCKHCYDRSARAPITLSNAVRILDDLRLFCNDRYVTGAVSFTGGNPLLHPDFSEIYRAAAGRGFTMAILGNPAPREKIAQLIEIQMPAFYQVSLEGLRDHNDTIRGHGHFDRVMTFLDVLKELRVSSMVMLTLTSENIGQVLSLAEVLRNKADVFHFNRLSMVGEGANLKLPDVRTYRTFLESYLDAARDNPVMGIKDNLINIIHQDRGNAPFGGCTGYGCGAAFNFMALLTDGEVHACRKFPSLIGNIHRQSIAAIYDSEQAQRYRSGCAACRSCSIRPVCGGCLASAHSHDLNVFESKDPFCFLLNYSK